MTRPHLFSPGMDRARGRRQHGAMSEGSGDPLLAHHRHIVDRVQAWREAWTGRARAESGAVARVLSTEYLGEPLSMQIERRLLEARREIDNEIARFAGMLAAAVALACRAGDTDAIERRTQLAFLEIGKVEDGFESKMAELEPLVRYYATLKQTVGPSPK